MQHVKIIKLTTWSLGMVQSDMSKPALIFFFTARVHTTKSTVKILAANTHCKYFLKIAEVTHFFCTRNGLYQRFVQPLLPLTGSLTLGSVWARKVLLSAQLSSLESQLPEPSELFSISSNVSTVCKIENVNRIPHYCRG
jgi:hypothetical protein